MKSNFEPMLIRLRALLSDLDDKHQVSSKQLKPKNFTRAAMWQDGLSAIKEKVGKKERPMPACGTKSGSDA